jgi:hypothetical protein
VIVWLHGAFGAGKSSVAEEIGAQRPGLILFDPEAIGYLLRDLLPVRTGDFQDLPEWRELVVATGAALDGHSRRLVLAAMTLLREDYAEEIFGGLRSRNVTLHHVLLDVDDVELRRRIETDAVAGGDPVADRTGRWRLEQLKRYGDARPWLNRRADVTVDTKGAGVPEIAATILADVSARKHQSVTAR